MKVSIPRRKPENFLDYFSLTLTTCGVGYLPLAPGTWGSLVGVGIYLLARSVESGISANFSAKGWTDGQIAAWVHAANLIIFVPFCLLGIWAAGRSTELLGSKDPSQAVIDEVIGQLIVFLFVPFDISWKFVLTGFILFRIFDVWKPYPINSLENLPSGIGICADDILAGVYGGTILILIYAIFLSV